MQSLVRTMIAALFLTGLAQGDVFYEEEVVNGGIGSQKKGAQKTVNRIYLKGPKQKVQTQVETSKEASKSQQNEGQNQDGSTLLYLDSKMVYEIDNFKRVYTQEKLPAAKPVAKQSSTTGPKPVFRVKELPDTTRILGFLCHKIAVEMRVAHAKKENRYLYQAYMARDLPGLAEIEQFRKLQASQTSYPSLIKGGLEQLQGVVEDYDQLTDQMKVLQGFPMQSDLKVYVKPAGGKSQQVFQLSRKVRQYSHSPLKEAEFKLAKDLQEVKK
ncbi:MAG: hypothetical protein GKR89_20825 [Candidatus Latescibacteria bacterium]|nr:hypothetical protein [Candidatus Latescibacterota bacterium]